MDGFLDTLKRQSTQDQIKQTYPLEQEKVDVFYKLLRGNCPNFGVSQCGNKMHSLQQKYNNEIAIIENQWVDNKNPIHEANKTTMGSFFQLNILDNLNKFHDGGNFLLRQCKD